MAALRSVGASVFSTATIGKGFPDLVVGFRGVTYLMEVKAPTGKLRPAQTAFLLKWRGRAVVVHSVEEALRAIGAEH